MGASVNAVRNSDPLRLPDTFGGRALKADLQSEFVGIGAAVFEALFRHYGSVKAMAIDLGNADPSQVRAEIKAGDFRRFDRHADQRAKSVFRQAVDAAYAPLESPEDRAEHIVAVIRDAADELRQYIALKRIA